MKDIKMMSESFELGCVLAVSGGFMDAYSYICRDKVFANAQTGNILLFGINLSQGNFKTAFTYFSPVVSFAIGILLACMFKSHVSEENMFHWRQFSVLCEAIILLVVGFIPQDLNLLAHSLTSFACGIQVQSFKKINGNGIATTMCIGNLRSGTENIWAYISTKNKLYLEKGILYFQIIFAFALGAVLGDFSIDLFRERAIIVSSILLFLTFAMMFLKKEENGYSLR